MRKWNGWKYGGSIVSPFSQNILLLCTIQFLLHDAWASGRRWMIQIDCIFFFFGYSVVWEWELVLLTCSWKYLVREERWENKLRRENGWSWRYTFFLLLLLSCSRWKWYQVTGDLLNEAVCATLPLKSIMYGIYLRYNSADDGVSRPCSAPKFFFSSSPTLLLPLSCSVIILIIM